MQVRPDTRDRPFRMLPVWYFHLFEFFFNQGELLAARPRHLRLLPVACWLQGLEGRSQIPAPVCAKLEQVEIPDR